MPGQFKDTEIEGTVKGKEFSRLMKHFSKKGLLYVSFVLSFINGMAPLLSLIPMKTMTNMFGDMGVGPDKMLETCGKFCWQMACVAAAIIVLMVISTLLQSIVAPQFLIDLRHKLYNSLMYKDISYFDKTSTGAMVSRLSEGVSYVKDVYIDQIYITFNNVALALGGIVVAFVMSWKVTLVNIAFPIVIAVVLFIGNKITDNIWDQYEQAGTESTEKAVEVITEFRTVKSFDNEMTEASNYRYFLDAEAKILRKVSFVKGTTFGGTMILLVAMGLTMSYYTIWLMVRHEGDLDMYEMMNVSTALLMVAMGINKCLSLSDDLQKASLALRNILYLIESEPEIKPNEGNKMKECKGKIEFRNVSFKYGECEKYAVQHLSFTINAGETVAFVGESGCGKSTTLQLLQRFYDVESGSVLIDDVDIRTLKPTSLRSNIAIVPQGPVLFSMSVADNIKYGKVKSDSTEVANAARTGNAHDFIMELPQNYDTPVLQTSLSGGQKQRICISRAILADCPVLLLDEATAALDTESEQLVQESLERFRHGKTAILVAHRLATVVHADRILVFKDGAIAEEGTHTELLAKNGLYANLAKYQLE